MRTRSACVLAGLVVSAVGLSATPARADVHFISIREVYGGGAGALTNTRFVELQMYSGGQTNTSTASLEFFSASGSSIRTLNLVTDVTNGQNQRTILVGTSDVATQLGKTPDFPTMQSTDITPNAGAVCFESTGHGVIDCVAWGPISGPPSGSGTQASAITPGQSLERRITAGCATLLEAADDTDNSSADFQTVTPNPEANGDTPNETSCGGGGGQQGGDPGVSVLGLKAKTPGSKAVISGAIAPPAPGAKVKVTLFAKGSPFQKTGKKKDTLDADSRFKVRLAVPDDARKCKVTVAYDGQVEATKKFSC